MKALKSKENLCVIFLGDSREILKNIKYKVDLIVTSPPYADARKNHYDSIHPDKFAEWLSSFHLTFWNILNEEGSFVFNIKDKVVNNVRHRYVWDVILKLSENGWLGIDDYIWHKTNPMPGYWPTRLRDGWEYCFHLAKQIRPYINQDAVKIPVGDWAKTRLQNLSDNDNSRHNSENKSGFGRNISNWVDKKMVLPYNVLNIPLVGKNKGHPAVFPVELPSFFIKLLSKRNSVILDPFAGSGTTGIAALNLGRDCILIDNSEEYCKVCFERLLSESSPLLCNILLVNYEGIIIKSDNPKLINKSAYELFDKYPLSA